MLRSRRETASARSLRHVCTPTNHGAGVGTGPGCGATISRYAQTSGNSHFAASSFPDFAFFAFFAFFFPFAIGPSWQYEAVEYEPR